MGKNLLHGTALGSAASGGYGVGYRWPARNNAEIRVRIVWWKWWVCDHHPNVPPEPRFVDHRLIVPSTQVVDHDLQLEY